MLITDDIQLMRRRLLVLAILFPVLCLASIAASIFQDYRATLSSAETDAERISTALGEHANRALGEADRVLLSAISDITEQDLSLQDETTLYRLLKSYSNGTPQFLAINAVDATGKVVASGLGPVKPVNVSDRDYFQYHETPGSSGIYVSRAIKSRTSGQWIFTISRALKHPDGSLKLILAAGMSVAYFESFYRSLNLGANGRLLLVRRDGWVLVESPMAEEALDTNIEKAPLFAYFRKSAAGSYHVQSGVVDGTSRIVGYINSSSYPFLAVASLSKQDLLLAWSRRARHATAWGMGSAALMLLLIDMLRRRFSDLWRVQSDLQEKNKILALSERRYQELVNGIDGIVWEAEYPSLCFSYVSSSAGKITGYQADEWLRSPDFWQDRLGTERKTMLGVISPTVDGNSSSVVVIEHHVVSPAGEDLWLLNNLSLTEFDGRTMLRGVMVDNTERRRVYEERELAAQVFENSLLGIIIASREGTILKANNAFREMMGYSEAELIGQNTALVDSDFRQATFSRTVKTSLRRTGRWQGEVHVRAKDGSELILMHSMSVVRDEYDKVKAVIVICKDITGQILSDRRMYQMAHFDHLTSLPNRQTLSDRIEHAIAIAERQNARLALMFLDLDQFKTINDTLGHGVGDQVLRTVSERISNCLRLSDTVARVGGDEFVVLLEELDADQHAIEHIAQKLCASVSEVVRINGIDLYVGLSIGVSLYPQDGRDSETLLRNADTAMYRAKLAGRSCWRFFDEAMASSAARRLELRMALRNAVERDELVLYYQPQRSLHTGDIIGVEALIRWHRPGNGTISPLEFIPISEESSLIISIGNWVLRTACQQAAYWLKEMNLHLRVGVNITAKQIRHDGFVEEVRYALQQSGLPPDLLELEITEGSMLENVEETVAKLTQLKSLGVTLAIDDFGTGYSSLSYLTQLPVDRLKIDQSFVRETPSDPHYCTIIRTIIAMSDNLGLSVIAEGVESQEQSNFLRAEGCDEIQGYLLSAPRPASTLAEML